MGPTIKKKKSNVQQSEQQKQIQSMETAKRYSTNNLVIDQQKLWSNDSNKNNNINKRDSAKKYQYLLTQLTGMGWDYSLSLAALKASNGNLHLAMESLMSGIAKTDVPRKQQWGKGQNVESKVKSKPRASSSMMKVKEAVKTAYISYEISKGKAPSDVQAFVFYCKNRRNIKKANWTVCQ